MTIARHLRVHGRVQGVWYRGWTVETATDMLWSLISTDMIDGLLSDRRWSRRRLATQLSLLLRSAFVSEPASRSR